MQKASWGLFCFILYAVFAVSLTASADVGSEVFVVSSSLNGDANYMSVTDEGLFSSQEVLHLGSETEYNVMMDFSYGNGLGDFDGDGDLDYIMAIGFLSGNIYIHEKLNDGNQFADPYLVNTWGLDTWGEEGGYYAMDMAVADYNEDGKDDFVLSLGMTASSGLYMTASSEPYIGEGEFGFEATLLPQTAAESSAGADAADFNNDGHADFVIAPNSNEQFFVSLGDGTGKFTTTSFSSEDGSPVWGVAAADFTGDGIADIAAAYFDLLYIYEGAIVEGEWDIDENGEWVNVGNGGTIDGVAFTYLASCELPMNQSAIDNYDFNGDGSQDLVVASYAADTAGVAVFIGNGDGTFEGDGTVVCDGRFVYDDTYLGGSALERNAVTAPFWEPVKNMEPVAVIEPAYLEVTAGDEIVFDGSKSYDDDGQIVGYEWDFGDADPSAASAPSANGATISLMNTAAADSKFSGPNPAHIYNNTGIYTVTLSVTDDKGAKSTVTAEVHVKEDSVPAIVKIHPRRLNLKSRNKWITAFIKLPKEYDPRQIDIASVSVYAGKAKLAAVRPNHGKHGFLAKIWRKMLFRRQVAAVRFDRQELIRAIGGASGNIDLAVKGVIYNNGNPVEFAGTDTIKTFEKSKKWSSFRKWKSYKK